MSEHRARPAPVDLGEAGRKLWRTLTRAFDFEPWEDPVLMSLCETADRLATVTAELDGAESLVVVGKQGERAHPLLATERDLRQTLLRHYAALRLKEAAAQEPLGEYDTNRRRHAAHLGNLRNQGRA